MTRNQPKPPETTQNQPKPAETSPSHQKPAKTRPSLTETSRSHCGPKQVDVIIDYGNYFLWRLQMAAEVIPPQMSKVNGIIREIMTAINKDPLISKLLFFCYMTCSNTIQLNQGDPCVTAINKDPLISKLLFFC